jgi:ubiquinone/menaquinone biosynthesis C-methylase UbiE
MQLDPNLETKRQRQYYTQTAAAYDQMHNAEIGEHALALKYILGFCRQYGLHRVLDVGCGTGVAVRTMLGNGIEAKGIEPVEALVQIGREKRGLDPSEILVGSAESLPFPDRSFDAVTEFAILHHIKEPAPAVREMIRVARHAIFLSDENRFGRGSLAWRLIKYFWWKTGVFPLGFWLMTKGKGYNFTEGDGVSYSYSVFDSVRELQAWADTIFFIPLKKTDGPKWAHPLFSSSHVLLCAIRHPEATAP